VKKETDYIEIAIKEDLYQKSKPFFDAYDLSVEQGIEAFLEKVISSQSIPLSIRKDYDINEEPLDNYMRSLFDIVASHCQYIYYVDMKSNQYREYTTSDEYRVLKYNTTGNDFFLDTNKNIEIIIHPYDRKRLYECLTKEYLYNELLKKPSIIFIYRMIIHKHPEYYMMTVSRVNTNVDAIVIEVRNVDQEVHREKEYKKAISKANKEARIDYLTGCYNFLSYQEVKDHLDLKIANGEFNFAFAMCDLNDLKKTNDRSGHLEGDNLLKNAASLMKKVFSHSKIFRLGGDEFVILLEDADYQLRYELVETFKSIVHNNKINGGVVIAIGLGEFSNKIRDLNALFNEADKNMYQHKKELKNIR